jgi:hypothetical protein
MASRPRTKNRKSRPPFVTPPNVPTFDCDEIVHIARMGDRLMVYLAGSVPVARGAVISHREETKVAVLFPIKNIPKAVRQVEAAAGLADLLGQEDFVGEPQGEA